MPRVQPRPEWRETKGSVSRETRQNIVDGLKLDKVPFNGRSDEVEFLQRIFESNTLPSHDSRFNLPELTKLVAKELQLVPDGISDSAKGAEIIRLVLQNLQSLTHYLAELRGLYGTGHGKDGKHRGLEPRHARLAVGSAVTFIDFISDTYRRRTETKQQ